MHSCPRNVVVLHFCCIFFLDAATGAALPPPWNEMRSLTPAQALAIQDIHSQSMKELETFARNTRESRTSFHRSSHTEEQTEMDVLDRICKERDGQRALERAKIFAILDREQIPEAVALYSRMVQTAAIEKFDLVKAKQQTQVWCWAACLQMLLNYGGVPWKQDDIVNQIKGELVQEDATGPEIAKGIGINHLDVDIKKSWRCQCDWHEQVPPEEMLISTIRWNRPMLVALDHRHVVVVYKVSFREEPKKFIVESVTFFDPLTGKDQTMDWNDKATKVITGWWYTWVATSGNSIF